MEYPISLDNSSGMASEMKMSPMGDKHPILILHWNKDYHLPDEGEMTVKFHKHRETNVDQEGKISQTVELHIMTIESVKAEKGEKKSPRKEAEEALDAAMEDATEGDY